MFNVDKHNSEFSLGYSEPVKIKLELLQLQVSMPVMYRNNTLS